VAHQCGLETALVTITFDRHAKNVGSALQEAPEQHAAMPDGIADEEGDAAEETLKNRRPRHQRRRKGQNKKSKPRKSPVNDGSHHGVACDVSVGLGLLIMLEVLRNSTSEARARSRDEARAHSRDGRSLAVNVRYWHLADIKSDAENVRQVAESGRHRFTR
jgi:hypothetical protein